MVAETTCVCVICWAAADFVAALVRLQCSSASVRRLIRCAATKAAVDSRGSNIASFLPLILELEAEKILFITAKRLYLLLGKLPPLLLE